MIPSKPSRPRPQLQKLITVMNVMVLLTGIGAVAALVLEYGGFKLSQRQEVWLHRVEVLVLGLFMLDRILRWLAAVRRWAYVRENWLDFVLIVVVVAAAVGVWQFRIKAMSAGLAYVFITQAYIVISLVLRAVGLNMRLAGSGIPPTWLLVGSFALVCLVGSGLLMLPAATPAPGSVHYRAISYVDALFTSVSATCVTGLVVRNTATEFTPFGQAVILTQIQIGGLGIMLFGTALALAVGKGLSLRGSTAVGEMLAVDMLGEVRRTMRFVVLTTLVVELIGAALMFGMFAAPRGDYSPPIGEAVWHSVFHSISSFCNAGFALYGRNMMAGAAEGWATPLRDHWQIMGVMAPLIVLGGLGFPVLQDTGRYLRQWFGLLIARCRPTVRSAQMPRPRALSLHSKLVLTASAALLVVGAVVLLLVEPRGGESGYTVLGTVPPVAKADWPEMAALQRVRAAAFQSVSARTAGFNIIDMAELTQTGKLWMCGLMTIGGSPAGTAGGMKTVAFVILLLAAYSALRRRTDLEVFRRRISLDLFQRVVAIGVLYVGLVIVVTFLLSVTMRSQYSLIDLLFEACSACGTVGLSTGVTADLTGVAECVIIGAMFVGRLGPLTLLLAATSHLRKVHYTYATETVVIG